MLDDEKTVSESGVKSDFAFCLRGLAENKELLYGTKRNNFFPDEGVLDWPSRKLDFYIDREANRIKCCKWPGLVPK